MRLRHIIATILAFLFLLPTMAQKEMKRGLNSIDMAAAKAHVLFLASDAMKGRGAGSNEGHVAAEYIASQLKQMGVAPLLKDGYFQPFQAYNTIYGSRWQVHPDSIASLRQQKHETLSMRNVLGVIPGKRADEYVIIGAHFDHLGCNPSLHTDSIYNGADDNASGVSAALQLARAFAVSGKQPERTVVFAFWDGEELGLLGSKYFVQTHDCDKKLCAYLNYDMIGRNTNPQKPWHVVYFYTEANPAFGQWLKDDIKKFHLKIEPDYRPWDKPFGGSDNASFARRGVPIIWYHTDGHPDYHKPTDHADRLNWDKVVEITKASFLNAWHMANDKEY